MLLSGYEKTQLFFASPPRPVVNPGGGVGGGGWGGGHLGI